MSLYAGHRLGGAPSTVSTAASDAAVTDVVAPSPPAAATSAAATTTFFHSLDSAGRRAVHAGTLRPLPVASSPQGPATAESAVHALGQLLSGIPGVQFNLSTQRLSDLQQRMALEAAQTRELEMALSRLPETQDDVLRRGPPSGEDLRDVLPEGLGLPFSAEFNAELLEAFANVQTQCEEPGGRKEGERGHR